MFYCLLFLIVRIMFNSIFSGAALGILVLSGLLLLPVLLPIAYTAVNHIDVNETTSNGTFDQLDKLSMGHVPVSTLPFLSFLALLNLYAFIEVMFDLWK